MEILKLCPRDDFPVIKIHGRWECVAEYVDRCIGGQRIVDVVKQDGAVHYVFENGHKLPMLCFCCDEPLQYEDFAEARGRVIGYHLESMAVEPMVFEDGQEHMQFTLMFAHPVREPSDFSAPVSLAVAAQMHHPATCRNLPRPRPRKPKRRR